MVQVDELEHLLGLPERLGCRATCAAGPVHRSDADVFQNGQIGERPHDLKRARNAHPADQVRPQASERPALELDRATCQLRDPCDDVDQRRLAGAVRPDQAHDLAGMDVEADVLDGHDTAEVLGGVAHLQNRRAHTRWATRLRAKTRQVSGVRVAMNSITPRGMNRTTSTTSRAKMTPCQARNSALLDQSRSAS